MEEKRARCVEMGNEHLTVLQAKKAPAGMPRLETQESMKRKALCRAAFEWFFGNGDSLHAVAFVVSGAVVSVAWDVRVEGVAPVAAEEVEALPELLRGDVAEFAAVDAGLVVLEHDGTLPEDVRMEEAKAFAHHLLCPRPLIYSIQKTGIRLTVDILGNLTGCYGTCLACMRRIPAVNVPPELNRKIRDNFMPYILNFFDFEIGETAADGSESADFGSYMDNYKE